MVIAGNNQVGFTCDRTFEDPIIVVIRRNGIDREVGNDNLRDLGQQLQLSNGLFVISVVRQNSLSKPAGGKAASATETGAENSSRLIHNGRRNQEYIAVFQGRSPNVKNVKRVASPVGEGRNIDIGVENDPKLFGFGDAHG